MLLMLAPIDVLVVMETKTYRKCPRGFYAKRRSCTQTEWGRNNRADAYCTNAVYQCVCQKPVAGRESKLLVLHSHRMWG